MHAIFYGGPNHGRISHRYPNIPEGCKTIHGVALIVSQGYPKDSIYQSTIEEWTHLLSDTTPKTIQATLKSVQLRVEVLSV